MAKRFSVDAVFSAVDQVTAPINRMEKRVARFSRRTTRNLKAMSRTTGGLSSKVLGVGKAFVAAATVMTGAAVAIVKNQTQIADNLIKNSRLFGFNIESMQEWQHVASLSGASQRLLNSSMIAFTKREGEAKNGIGSLSGFGTPLSLLGI